MYDFLSREAEQQWENFVMVEFWINVDVKLQGLGNTVGGREFTSPARVICDMWSSIVLREDLSVSDV